MAELAPPISGELIESAWGTAINDRVVSRYSNATDRDTKNPLPVAGDTGYLEDVRILQVYSGTQWIGVANLTGATFTGGVQVTDDAGFGVRVVRGDGELRLYQDGNETGRLEGYDDGTLIGYLEFRQDDVPDPGVHLGGDIIFIGDITRLGRLFYSSAEQATQIDQNFEILNPQTRTFGANIGFDDLGGGRYRLVLLPDAGYSYDGDETVVGSEAVLGHVTVSQALQAAQVQTNLEVLDVPDDAGVANAVLFNVGGNRWRVGKSTAVADALDALEVRVAALEA